MLKQSTKIALLSGLAVTAAAIWFFHLRPNENPQPSSAAPFELSSSISFPNLGLRTAEIDRRRAAVYQRHGADLTGYAISHPPTPRTEDVGVTEGPIVSTTPQPVTVPAKFFGYGNVPINSPRKAFFEDGQEVHIVSEGETFLTRFRVVKIYNDAIEVEELGSGRRVVQPLELQGPAA
jgi:hypothetical protein